MNRSAQPLPSGARTKAGELSMPRKRSSSWKSSGHVLAPVVVADGEAAGDALGEAAEVAAHALADRLQGLEAGGAPRRVDADALGRAVVDGDEHRGLALAGPGGGQVGAPHRVHVSGMMVPSCERGPRGEPVREGREQAVLAHQPQHPALEVRTPPWRSRAQTLRCPSPWKGLAASTARIRGGSVRADGVNSVGS
jgi:hypothetical protein